jgi:hypothetical protein
VVRNVSFVRSGDFAARTNEKEGFFLAAAGGKAFDAASISADCVSRVK